MPNELRFVLDTNVMVSALLLKQSIARQAFDKAMRVGKLLISQATVEELNAVPRRKGFEPYITESERLEFLGAWVRDAILIGVTERVAGCRDPKDDKISRTGVDGRAHCIVTGDEDLLELHPFRGIAIPTPRQFLDYPVADWGETRGCAGMAGMRRDPGGKALFPDPKDAETAKPL
ncbi:MAG: putative toxin-antitoxin system toxin component, PIN family [Anaerolineae bacterium]|nr:putative toxin-antitoxin system toxin component, PIN family [Anaerolineae bacterium]